MARRGETCYMWQVNERNGQHSCRALKNTRKVLANCGPECAFYKTLYEQLVQEKRCEARLKEELPFVKYQKPSQMGFDGLSERRGGKKATASAVRSA